MDADAGVASTTQTSVTAMAQIGTSDSLFGHG
jgi:hypothetical protein